jgi:hypothetical protein
MGATRGNASRASTTTCASAGAGDVVGPFREDAGRAGGERRVDVSGRGQDLVVDADRRRSVGRPVGIVGQHHRHRFAHVAHHLARDGGMGIRPESRGGDEGRDGRLTLGQVSATQHRDHAGHGARGHRIDAGQARVGVRAPDDGRVEHVGQA